MLESSWSSLKQYPVPKKKQEQRASLKSWAGLCQSKLSLWESYDNGRVRKNKNRKEEVLTKEKSHEEVILVVGF